MAIVEYNMVSPEAFNEFVPDATIKQQSKNNSIILGLILISVTGLVMYAVITKNEEERLKFL